MSQTETGQVVGVVTDPSGAVVPKAKVTLKSVGTGAERSTVTDEAGSYVFAAVLPAVYSVTVEAGGFAKMERRVQVTVGSKVTLDIALTLGAAQSIVEITAEAGVAINTETQTISQVIDTKKITELPTLTRNPYDLAATAGNVSGGDPTGRGVGVAINGQRAAATNILLDGGANNDEFVAAVGQHVPLDAVQEFSMITNNFTAEYGRASGGIVNLATKSGTNEYHGTAYEFNRVSKLASWSFLDKAQGTLGGAPKNPKQRFTRNQFGYSVGGPVLPSLKDKLFFFSSTEWTRVRSASNVVVLVPTPAFISLANANTQNFFTAFGTLASGVNTIGTVTRANLIAAGADPCTALSVCDTLVAPATVMFNRVQYSRPADSGGGDPQDTYFLVGRADWVINSKTTFYSRYALEKSNFFPGTVSHSPYSGFNTGATVFNNNILISLNRQWTNRLNSQSKIVYNRLNSQQPHGARPSTPTLYWRNVTQRFLGDRAALPGYLPFSPGSGIPFGGPQNVGQVYQDISYIRGKHQLRFGGSYVYIQDNRVFGAYQDPSQTLSTSSIQTAMNNFLNGVLRQFQAAVYPQGKFPCRYTIISGQPCGQDTNLDGLITGAEIDPSGTLNLPVGQPDFSRSNRYHEFAVYGQDSWRIHPRVTLNLGMRWEYYGVQHNKDPNKDSNYYDGAGGSIFAAIRSGGVSTTPNSPIGGLWQKDWNNFAPRVGFAWDVFGNGKTSIRGGYAVGYERNFGNVTFNVIQNPPNYAVISITAPIDVATIPISTSVAGPLAGSTGVKALPKVSLRNVVSNIRTAYAHLWSLSVEREVLKNLFVEVDYSGSKGEKLYSLENPSRPGAGNVYLGDPCTLGNPFSCTSRLINTQYTNINRRGNKAFSTHNAMNVRVTSKNIYNSGLVFTANYTWAHSIDNLSSTFSESGNNFNLGLLDPFNPKLDRGNADFDIRHRFVFSGIWDIPFAKSLKGPAYYILHGWTVAPIFAAITGLPFTVYDCNDAYFSVCPRMFASGTAVTRKGAKNPPADPSTPGTFTYINLAGQFNLGGYLNPITGSSEFGPFPANMTARNYFRGPGAWGLDLGIYKKTKITERYSIQFRGELYNMFNHANAYVLGSETDVSGQSVVRSQKDGRRNIQLAVKFIF
ncbi:MAG: carboxypeptidase regulatory-like domain-containing protein [Acidobacteria bacterium]|nr:carboxypeptidase regulatory-like domain-containing protein [Acidobacteriota bacterium]